MNHIDSSPVEADASTQSLGMIEIFREVLEESVARLYSQLEPVFQQATEADQPVPCERGELVELLSGELLDQVTKIADRSLVLELNVARLRNELSGATPAERFASFIARLQQPAKRDAFLQEYIVLAQRVADECERWLERSCEFAVRCLADWQGLAHVCADTPADFAQDRLVALDAAGDRHCAGRRVMILHLASGRRVVYKPRSMEADERFADLLQWANARGFRPRFSSPRLWARVGYGWVQYLTPSDCASPAAVRRFFRRQGGYLALLYLLGATDMHYENILAHGEHPMLIDLEALFHQRLPDAPAHPVSAGLSSSVVAVRMLPQAAFVPGLDQPVDFSGLGASAGGEIPFRALKWQGEGTDELQCAPALATMPEGHHRPRWAGQPVTLLEESAAFRSGFAAMYRLIAAHRAELVDPDGPLVAFAKVPLRFIPRPSQVYALLLEQSFHPDHSRTTEESEACFDRLEVRARQFPSLRRLQDAERRELHRGDIPLFRCRPDARHLWTSDGELIADFFPAAALDLALDRLAQLGPEDLLRQLWLIDASLAMGRELTSQANSDDSALWNAVTARSHASQRSATSSRRRAVQLGRQLEALAFRDSLRAGWLTVVPRERGLSLGPVELTRPETRQLPIALARLWRISGQRRFGRLALAAARYWLERLHESVGAAEEAQPVFADFEAAARSLYQTGAILGHKPLMRRAKALRNRARRVRETSGIRAAVSGGGQVARLSRGPDLPEQLGCELHQLLEALARQIPAHPPEPGRNLAKRA